MAQCVSDAVNLFVDYLEKNTFRCDLMGSRKSSVLSGSQGNMFMSIRAIEVMKIMTSAQFRQIQNLSSCGRGVKFCQTATKHVNGEIAKIDEQKVHSDIKRNQFFEREIISRLLTGRPPRY